MLKAEQPRGLALSQCQQPSHNYDKDLLVCKGEEAQSSYDGKQHRSNFPRQNYPRQLNLGQKPDYFQSKQKKCSKVPS